MPEHDPKPGEPVEDAAADQPQFRDRSRDLVGRRLRILRRDGIENASSVAIRR
jgi:hypothetical protein